MCLQVGSAADRPIHFLLVETAGEPRLSGLLRGFVARNSLALIPGDGAALDLETLRQRAESVLRRHGIIGVALNGHDGAKYGEKLLESIPAATVPIVPVYCNIIVGSKGNRRVSIVIGEPLPPETPLPAIREAIRQVGETFDEQKRTGCLASSSVGGAH
jgi:hypothetical protein